MQLGQNIFARLKSIDPDDPITDYKTKAPPENVSDIKSFDECVEAARQANERIISKQLERDRYIRDAEKQLFEMDDDIDNSKRKIEAHKTHIVDILRRAFPSATIDWGETASPDELEDVVFDPPPVPTEET